MTEDEFFRKLKKLKCLFFDVDGVFTDGGVYYSDTGTEIKKFNTLDGVGLILLEEAGILPVILTARDNKVVRNRFEELGCKHIYSGVIDKSEFVLSFIKKQLFSSDQVGFMGDDLPDYLAFKDVGIAFSVPNSPPIIRNSASYITNAKGGNGAVREICDLVLKAQEKDSISLFQNFIESKKQRSKNAET